MLLLWAEARTTYIFVVMLCVWDYGWMDGCMDDVGFLSTKR